jgi:hypothetical protein
MYPYGQRDAPSSYIFMPPGRVGQKLGFGGADSQVWIAEIRFGQP